MSKDIPTAVREVCLSFPDTEEIESHGSPDFRVGGKTFATFAINHHGDGHLALWLNAPPGAQQLYTDAEPEHYYVPPYVGPRGWLGVDLDRGLSWTRIADHVREAWLHTAPAKLARELGPTIEIEPPDETIDPAVFDPYSTPEARAVLDPLREFCLALPEVTESTQFGTPVWKAGKKTFVGAHAWSGELELTFWAGTDKQAMLTFDDARFRIPQYTGHNGWINLNVAHGVNWDEVHALTLDSYRHFALKRMLKALDG